MDSRLTVPSVKVEGWDWWTENIHLSNKCRPILASALPFFCVTFTKWSRCLFVILWCQRWWKMVNYQPEPPCFSMFISQLYISNSGSCLQTLNILFWWWSNFPGRGLKNCLVFSRWHKYISFESYQFKIFWSFQYSVSQLWNFRSGIQSVVSLL